MRETATQVRIRTWASAACLYINVTPVLGVFNHQLQVLDQAGCSRFWAFFSRWRCEMTKNCSPEIKIWLKVVVLSANLSRYVGGCTVWTAEVSAHTTRVEEVWPPVWLWWSPVVECGTVPCFMGQILFSVELKSANSILAVVLLFSRCVKNEQRAMVMVDLLVLNANWF